jgi:hypothetical protein
LNKRPNLKQGEASIIAKFKTVNGVNFCFKQRGRLEDVAESFLNQAKAAGHEFQEWDKKPFFKVKEHLNKKKKELNESFLKEFK